MKRKPHSASQLPADEMCRKCYSHNTVITKDGSTHCRCCKATWTHVEGVRLYKDNKEQYRPTLRQSP